MTTEPLTPWHWRRDGASATNDTDDATGKAVRTRKQRRTTDTSVGVPFCTGTSRIVHPHPTLNHSAEREATAKWPRARLPITETKQHVIPVGAGPVKSLPGVVIFLFVFSVRFGRAELRRRGQGSAEGRPRSGRRSLTPTPDGACCLRRRKWGGLLLGSMVAGRVRAPARFPGCGQARLGAVGHPFAARWRHGVLRQVRSVGINQMGRPRQGWGS